MNTFHFPRVGVARAGLLATLLLPGWATAAGLDDTGATLCGNLNQDKQSCPQTNFPSQDAETGRDAQQTAGTLSKAGGGAAGFDFTKLDSAGAPLAASAVSWDCVRDNVTGLIWEVKTDNNGLRDKDWSYTWCNNNASTNGGGAGVCDTGSSVGSDNCANTARCDTEKYVADVNALNPNLCGHTDWRMPTREELRSIVDYSIYAPSGVNPTIDVVYFPNTRGYPYWSASPSAPDAGYAWLVDFYSGFDGANNVKGNYFAVRLVRGGQ